MRPNLCFLHERFLLRDDGVNSIVFEGNAHMYVYFIATRNRTNGGRLVVKIGKAGDPRERLSDLQVGNHEQLRLIAKIPCRNDEQAYRTEKYVHRFFRKKRLHGEWFALTDAEVNMMKRSLLTATSVRLREEDDERRADEINLAFDREFSAIIGTRQ